MLFFKIENRIRAQLLSDFLLVKTIKLNVVLQKISLKKAKVFLSVIFSYFRDIGTVFDQPNK